MNSLDQLKKELKSKENSQKAKLLRGFFKTGKGEYAEGDVFLGVMVPKTRETAIKFYDLPLEDVEELLHSKIHEERLCALLLLVHNFKKGDEETKKEIYEFYLRNTEYINNWDLVDLSCHKIIGAWLADKDRRILYKLAKSKHLWEKRIAIISTAYFIAQKDFEDTLKISEILMNDKHDLIHKAVGWMLREVGKKDFDAENRFLQRHYKKMPRTMLRYAIERFPESERKKYLDGSA